MAGCLIVKMRFGSHLYGTETPASDDDWVIGGPEQIRALIADLTSALEKL